MATKDRWITVRAKEDETMGNAYRDGWDRTFGPKESPRMLRCPFPLRRGLQIEVTLPDDLKLADLRRFVWYLVTMCDDWDEDDGFPSFAWPDRKTAEVFSNVVRHAPNQARDVGCPKCSAVFVTFAELKAHAASVHVSGQTTDHGAK
ncbi:MAG: hypothetical protein WBW31_18100 [Candidatus Sulfotelmatobacter sp.]